MSCLGCVQSALLAELPQIPGSEITLDSSTTRKFCTTQESEIVVDDGSESSGDQDINVSQFWGLMYPPDQFLESQSLPLPKHIPWHCQHIFLDAGIQVDLGWKFQVKLRTRDWSKETLGPD